MRLDVPTSVRLPRDLRDRLSVAASSEMRSLSAEIVLRLQRDLGMPVDGGSFQLQPPAPLTPGGGCWSHRGHPKSWCVDCKGEAAVDVEVTQ